MKVEEAIQKWMVDHKKTLALAESVTGGHLAAKLTAIPGASSYFLGSLVVYSNALKQNLLHVSEKTLKDFGAVSRETVEEMARNLLRVIQADFGIAVCGIAGPSGGNSKTPVGAIWAALIRKGESPKAWSFHVVGDRKQVIASAVDNALAALLEELE